MKVFKSKEEEPTAPGQVSIKKRSRVPGVMITQFVEGIPPGKSHPDFSRKPIALTIQEGKLAVFKAIVTGDPTPTIRWIRSNGDTSDKEKYITVYNQVTGEHQLQMPNVAVDQADTYKCLAENELGFATVTAALNVIETQREHPADFKKTLKTRADRPKNERKDGEVDEKFWELLLSADRKDYERICAEYGVTDFRWMLKKLNEKKREIEEQQAQYIDYLGNLKHIEMKSPACAQFEFEIDLKDPNARIFLYKDGNMIPFSSDTDEKHSLHQIGRRLIFSVNGLTQDDAGLYQVDIEGVNVFSTDFKIPVVDFLVKIQEVKAIEREDAVFECVLSAPFAKITWMGKSTPLVQGKKYGITVSEDMLIHRLLVKDCMKVDTGIYAAVAGIKSCNAWLIVEADNNPNNHGKKAARKTTQAGGSGDDLSKVAAQQQAKLQKAREEKTEMLKQHQAKQAVVPQAYEHEPMTKPPTGPQTKPLAQTSSPGVHFTCGLQDVRAIMGQTAEMVCKLSSTNCNGVWYKDGKESIDDLKIIKDGAFHKLLISNCKEDDNGKYRFEADGHKTEAILIVEDPPKINKDDLTKFSEPVIIKVGQNATFSLSFVGKEPVKIHWYNKAEELFNGTNIKIEKSSSHSSLLLTKCQRKDTGEIKLKLKNEFGTTEAFSSLIVLDKPTHPVGPTEVIEASSSCVEFKWRPPKDDGGSSVTQYNLERQQLGRNTWKKIGNIPGEAHYKDTDVDHGRKYCYRIRAITAEGISDVFETDDIQAGTKAYPGPPSTPKVDSAFKECINLSWAPPTKTGGTSIVGYNLEKRKRGSNLWSQVNPPDEPIRAKKYGVKDVVEGIEYEFRVSAINFSGVGDPSSPTEFVIARDPKMRPNFLDRKLKSFMVVRAGNSARVNITFEASPMANIIWVKDGIPMNKRVTVSNTEGTSQLLIPSAERCDSGIYTITVKNIVGQETFSTEIRVTDDPKPPGPVELEENVPGTLTMSWSPSPDEKQDDRLHYTVAQRDSVKQTWHTVADHLFNNNFTAVNIMPGREYNFRVYAKNDMGLSQASKSPTWGIIRKKESNRIFTLTYTYSAPIFTVPLKAHISPEKYECYMSCAVRGNPSPHITWYHNNISINTNTNYYITNTCGVCSLLILRVGSKDNGEYKVVAENSVGHAECTTKLTVRGML
uniref:Immunoglobulin like and fibronectin type III domain containing 1, tandem duplicate 3 n=1 Tax=Electrophorus electricus TaxID=8005 RepID=A0A4W4EYX0_ELEEL